MTNPYISESAIAFPFSIDSLGNVTKTVSQEKIWQDRISSAVGTLRGQRLLRTGYGTDMGFTTFDTVDAMTAAVEQEVINVFEREFSTIRLEQVTVEFKEANNIIDITVQYILPDLRSSTTRVAIAYTNKDALIQEVNL